MHGLLGTDSGSILGRRVIALVSRTLTSGPDDFMAHEIPSLTRSGTNL